MAASGDLCLGLFVCSGQDLSPPQAAAGALRVRWGLPGAMDAHVWFLSGWRCPLPRGQIALLSTIRGCLQVGGRPVGPLLCVLLVPMGPEPGLWLLVPRGLGALGFCRLSQPGSFGTTFVAPQLWLPLLPQASGCPVSMLLSRNGLESLLACRTFPITAGPAFIMVKTKGSRPNNSSS